MPEKQAKMTSDAFIFSDARRMNLELLLSRFVIQHVRAVGYGKKDLGGAAGCDG